MPWESYDFGSGDHPDIIRIKHRGPVAERFDHARGRWKRHDAWYVQVAVQGEGAEVDEVIALLTVAHWLEARMNRSDDERLAG
jgi:hypothetical protein